MKKLNEVGVEDCLAFGLCCMMLFTPDYLWHRMESGMMDQLFAEYMGWAG